MRNGEEIERKVARDEVAEVERFRKAGAVERSLWLFSAVV